MLFLSLTGNGQLTEMGPADMARLVAAVREIVHPQAMPTPDMIMIATQQGGPPTTMMQMMQYTPSMVAMASRLGVKPPGINGTVTPQQLQEYIVQRGMNWMQRQASVAGMTSGEMGLGTALTAMGGLGGMNPGLSGGRQATPIAAMSGMPQTASINNNQMRMSGMGMGSMGGLGLMAMAGMDVPLLPVLAIQGLGGNIPMTMHLLGMDLPFAF